MLQNLPDPLAKYVTNKYLKFFLYFLSLGVFAGLIKAFGIHLLFGMVILYLAFIKISDEKVKWGVITILTLAILILGNNSPKNFENHQNKKEENRVENSKPQEPVEELFLVTKVIDGDTIEIEGGKRVRYIGIDTPETVDPNRPTGCYGKEASNKNSELVLNKKVRLVKDVSDTDRYGRFLRYVYIDDTFVNDYLVKEGYAKASTYAPDVKFSEQFAASEREARENKRGLWGSACELSVAPVLTPSIVAPAPTMAPAPVVAPAPVIQEESIYSGGSSNSDSGVVKKSTTGICHAPGTTYYNKTKNFTAYDTVGDCLNSGGRLPKR